MNDGNVKIGIDVENKKAKENLEKLKKDLQDLGDEVSKVDQKKMSGLTESMKKTSESVSETVESIKKLDNEIDELQLNLSELKSDGELNEIMPESALTYAEHYNGLLDEAITKKKELSEEVLGLNEKQAGQNKLSEVYIDRLDLVREKVFGVSEAFSEVTEKTEDWEIPFQNAVDKSQELNEELDGLDVPFQDANNKLDETSELFKEAIALSKGLTKSSEGLNSNLEETNESTKSGANNTKEMTEQFKKVSKSANNAKKSTGSMTAGIAQGVKSIMKYSLALFGIRSIFAGLKKLSKEFFDSNDQAVLQMKSNLGALSNGLTQLIAPALRTIIGWVTTLMGYVNALTKAFFGVELFTKKTAKNTGGMAGSVKKANKEAEKFRASFDEAEVITSQINDNLDSGGGGGGVAELPDPKIPTPDVSGIVKVFDDLMNELKPFFDTLKSIDFKPLEKSLKNLGNVAKKSLGILGDSFIRTMNNSVAPFIKLLAEDIVPKGLDTVAKIIDRLNPVIDNLLKNFVEPMINWFLLDFVPLGLETVFNILDSLGGIIAVAIESFMVFWDLIGQDIATVAWELLSSAIKDVNAILETVTEGLDKWLNAIKEGDPLATALAGAIGLVIAALAVMYGWQLLVNGAMVIFNALGAMSPFGWVIIAITAVIAIIALLYAKWDDIKEFFKKTIDNIAKWFSDMGAKVGEIWDGIGQKVSDVRQWIRNKIGDAIQFVKDIFTGMGNWVGNVWNGVKEKFTNFVDWIKTTFKNAWTGAWNGIVTVFDNIVGGIANIFKFPINVIIDGLNSFIRGVNKIKIPNWVPVVGGKGINIGQIPRLAKGGVLNKPTLNIAGEAGKEAVVPLENNTGWINDFIDLFNANGGNQGSGSQVIQLVVDGKVLADVVNDKNEQSNFNMNGGGFAWNT